MAAIFQIRRGTTNESLTEGELYLHQGSGSLQFGSGSNNYNVLTLNAPVNGDVILTGNITASNAYFSGDVAISGNLFLGNNTGDNISVPGVFTTNLVPGGNGTLDLGTSGAKWRTVYANSISASFTGSVNGIDIVLLSSSIDSQFDAISIVSQSLNAFTASQESINTGYNTFTQSADSRLDNIELITSSLQGEVDNLQSVTASYATTGSNIFVGNQTISGSLTISGSSTFRNIGPTILSGSVLVSGSINSDGFELDASLTQNIPALNSTFNLDFSGSESTIIKKSLVLGDGKILIAGRFTSVDGHTTNDIARLNSNGTIDTSFSAPVFSTTIGGDTGGYVNTFVTQSDGKIIVGGNFSRVNGALRYGLARLDSDGILDTSFEAQSWGSFGEIRDIAIQSDNKIVCVGSFPSGSRRVNPDGTIDTSLVVSTSPGFGDDNFYSVALLPSGSEEAILIGGDFQQWNSFSDYHHLVKLHPSGALDFGFAGNNLDIATGNSLDRIQKIKVTDAYTAGDNGYIYIAGRFKDTRVGAQGRNAGFARLTTDDVAFGRGAYDNGFRLYISGSDQNTPGVQYVNDFDFYDGDKILIGGSFTSLGNPLASYQTTNRFIIVDYDNGSLIDGFSTSTYRLNTGSVNSVTLLPNDNVLVGGTFTQANLTAREGLASLKLAGLGEVTTTSEYTISANVNELLISSSNTYFSGYVSASVISSSFVGDGSGLTGVTAADVEFANVLNKPTLVSGSSQIISILNPLNNFSASVTSSLESIYQTTASLNSYTSSLKTAITVDGVNTTILGNLSVLGVTTTVHSNEVNIGDNIIQLNYGYSQTQAGIEVTDATGGSLLSGSLLWDSTIDYWKAGKKGAESKILLAGGDSVFTSSLQLTEINNTTASLNQTTASLNNFSASVTTSLESIYQTTSSLNLFSASVTASLVSVYQTTASLNLYTQSVNNDLASIHQSSASLNLFSASVTSSLESVYQTTASLNNFSASVTASLSSIYETTASLNNFSASVTSSLESVYQTTASLNNFSASVTASLESVYQTTASINLFSASVTASLESIYQTTASLNNFTGSQLTQNTALATITGSLIISASQSYISASLMTSSVKDHEERLVYLEGIGGISGGNPLTQLNTFSASAKISIENLNTFTSSFSESVSASIAALESSSGYINYVTNSIEQLTGIEVADFDSNVAVTFINGTLKFIFGTPAIPTSIATSLSGFLTDRFNNVNDAYIVNGTWSNQGYTLVSASLYEGSTLLTEVGSGTSLSFSTTTSGSHTYRLEYTASSPLDGTLYKTSTTATGTISKSSPASPTLTPTATVQLGASSNQIEQGATGSISFTSSSADPSNSWNLVNTTTNVSTPYFVTGSATGSTSISITATANYASPIGDNIPDLTTTSTTTTTYTKIRSLRYGASDASSFTAGELENIGAWDTTLGGSIGTISKGTTTASGQTLTISWTGDKYLYIVFDSARPNLTGISTSGFAVLGQFTLTTIGQYKVYRTTVPNAGGAGSSITYTLT
jgi:uncharacterized delta-60 repeat protein